MISRLYYGDNLNVLRESKSGNSEAIRLPKGVGFGVGAEIRINREGDRIVLTRVLDPAAENRKWLEMLDALTALRKPPYIQEREAIEFTDRFGP